MNLRNFRLLFRAILIVTVLLTTGQANAQWSSAQQTTIFAAGRGGPWVNLTDGEALITAYGGGNPGSAALAQGEAAPRSLASANLNGDAAPDLLAGYALGAGGLLAVHPGNPDRQALARFLPEAGVYALPEATDFLGAGDFDADGFEDVLAAANGGAALYFLPGDGSGQFGAPQPLKLPGPLTALAVGEIGRADGLADVAAGVTTPDGPRLLIFYGGDLSAAPAAFALPGEAAALGIGQLDEAFPYDVAIAAGQALVIIHGYDQLTGTATPAAPEIHPLEFAPISLALGDFIGGDNQSNEIALLNPDGQIHLFDRSGQPSTVSGLRSPSGHALLRINSSSLPADDLLVVGAGQAEIFTADGRRMGAEGLEAGIPAGSLAVLDGASIAAALPVRLNRDALTDLVFLAEGAAAPLLALTEPVHVFTVNIYHMDVTDGNIGDGKCDFWGFGDYNYCTLRAAIQEANASAGFDEIRLNYEYGVTDYYGALPNISEALSLIGNQAAGQYGAINGEQAGNATGLTITSGDVTMDKIAVKNFASGGVFVVTAGNNEFVECQFGPYNGAEGILIVTHNNTIRLSVLSGNYISGAKITGNNNILTGNRIGLWYSPQDYPGNTYYGIDIDGAQNTVIGGGLIGFENEIGYNDRHGIYIHGGAQGTQVMNNYIGVNSDGELRANGYSGVVISNASATTIGGPNSAVRNAISGNGRDGISVSGSATAGTIIQNNFIGPRRAVTGTYPNHLHGIRIFTDSDAVQVLENVIGGNWGNGISITKSEAITPPCIAHEISDNIIGADETYSLDWGNQQNGIFVSNVSCVTISNNYSWYNDLNGLLLEPAGFDQQATVNNNDLDSNGQNGLDVESNNNTLEFNSAVGNFYAGFRIDGNYNTLGNNAANGNGAGVLLDGDANVLSSSSFDLGVLSFSAGSGLAISGNQNTVTGYKIQGNAIGIAIEGDENEIGLPGSHNVIIGNQTGVEIAAIASANVLAGNRIGLDENGVAAANVLDNVIVYGSGNLIGGGSAANGNIIAASEAGAGIHLSGAMANSNSVRYNTIGQLAMGQNVGVQMSNGASDNEISNNEIAYNVVGVRIEDGDGNEISENSLHDNAALGIDLNPEGVTLNDTGDGDTGPNGLQNFPALTLAQVTADTRLQGSLDSAASQTFTLHFYNSTACDDSGYGEGQTYLGEASVTTNSSGQGAFDVTVSGAASVGGYIVATATDAEGNTSEFGRCLQAVAGSSTFTVNTLTDAADTNVGNGVCDSSAAAGEQCTLRAAIQETNAVAGDDTIILPAGTYPLTLSGLDNTAALGDLDITQNLTIIGSGAYATTVRSDVVDRVFDVRGSLAVTLVGLTVKGGHPGTSSDGGGILVSTNAHLTLDAVTVSGNQAPGKGGGIYSTGTITLTNSAVVSNTASSDGGGLYQLVGAATLVNTTVSTNQSNASGGGIYGFGGTLTLRNVTVAFNTADVDGSGGDAQGGGGLYNLAATFTLGNSVIAENLDISDGIYKYGTADCDGDFAALGYNLVGDKADPYTGDPACTLTGGTGNQMGGFWFGTNYLIYAAGLGPLSLNGGTTPSHSPVAAAAGLTVDWGSPETPGSSPSACEPYDQRGQPRPVDGGTDGVARCDRGAVEHLPSFISISDAAANEGSLAIFNVTLSEPAQITFTVEYATSDLSTVGGLDYIAASGVITFPIGSSQQTVQVTVLNDTLNETAETFQVTLSNARWAFVGDGEAIGSISDGSPMPSILLNDASAVEGAPGAGGQAVFGVTLNGPSGQTVTVDYTVAGDTAAADEDFVASQGQITFAAGETSKTVIVSFLGDDTQEGNETFGITLSSPVNASIGDASGVGTITDDDTAIATIGDATRVEGDSGTATMYFQITLSNPSTQQVTVQYYTSPGTAQAGSDYEHKSGVLIFEPGDTTISVAITINGDEDFEGSETFLVILHNPTGGSAIGDGQASGTIQEDDGYQLFLPIVRR